MRERGGREVLSEREREGRRERGGREVMSGREEGERGERGEEWER